MESLHRCILKSSRSIDSVMQVAMTRA